MLRTVAAADKNYKIKKITFIYLLHLVLFSLMIKKLVEGRKLIFFLFKM